MSEASSDNSARPEFGWRRLALAGGLCAAGVAVTWSAWADIVHIAIKDEEASHIWLVPVIVGWLVAVRLPLLAGYVPRTDPLGPVMMLAGWGASFYGFYHQVQSLWHGGALLMVLGCVVTVLGSGLIRLLPAAFVATLFVIPVPGMIRQEIAIPLQTATAAIAQFCFELLAIPVLRSGNLLSYNGVDVTVAEACNGMRMVFSLLSVCYVFAFGTSLRTSVRLTVLMLSPVIAVACNVLRVIPTVWMYGNYSTEVAETFHNLSGWVMIFLSFLILMGIVRLLEWAQIPVRPDPERAARRTPTAVTAALWPGRPWVTATLAVVALAAATVEGTTRPHAANAAPYHRRVAEAMDAAPRAFGDWTSRAVEVPTAAIEMLDPNAIISRTFENAATGESASLLIVHCKDARDMGGHYPPKCYPGVGWVLDGQHDDAWDVDGQSLPGVTYEFVRSVGLREHRIVISNLLAMPNGQYLRTMQGVYNVAADYTLRFFGAAQIQVVMSDQIPEPRRRAITDELLTAHAAVIEAITSADTGAQRTGQ